MGTLYLDPGGGNNANDATTFANRVKGFNSGITAARTAPGDTIRMMAARSGSLAGCSITAGNGTLTLPSGNHKILALCDATTGWTFATNITGATSTSRWEGTNCVSFTPLAAFGTGRIGYFDLGSSTDLSAFSAIHCALDCGNVAQTITLKLCSDATATTVVATMTYAGLAASSSVFHSALFNNGGALPSNVRTLAFEISADPGTTALRIDAIAACHDPAVTPNSITPWSVFSTAQAVADNFNTANDCSFQGIRHFLTDTTATLHGTGTSGVQTNCVWPHATLSSGTLYVWHAAQCDRLENSGNNVVNTIQEAGNASNVSVYEGGYNRTDMTTQDTNGMTVLVNSNFIGACFVGKSYTELRRTIFIGQQAASNITGVANFKLQNVAFVGASVPMNNMGSGSSDCVYDRVIWAGAGGVGTVFANERSKALSWKITNAAFNFALSEGLQVEDILVNRSASYGMIFIGGSCRQGYNVNKVVIKNTTTADLRCAIPGVSIKMYNVDAQSSTKFSVVSGAIVAQNYNGDTAAVSGAQAGILYTRDTTTVDGTAASSVRLLVNSTSFNTNFPVYWEGPTYKHASSISGASVTVSMRIKKSHATNIAGRLEVKRGIILASDATTTIPSDTNWNTVSVTFTPTADGPIEVYFELWSTASTESVYVNPESLTVTVA